MLETTAIPILMKAIDFLFEECRKVLDERRERRKQEPPTVEPEDPIADGSQTEQEQITTKETALAASVQAAAWQQSEEQVEHLIALLDIHLGNYRQLSKQYAQWTDALVPPIIVNSLKNEESKILEVARELQGILSDVYGQDVLAITPDNTESNAQ